MQETLYLRSPSHLPYMHRDAKTLLREWKTLFAERHKWLREINATTQAGMGREMKQFGTEGVSQKTISNIENLEGDPLISTYAAAAAYWGLPMWAMVVPGTTRDMFEDPTKIKRMVQLMQDYLDCPDIERSNIEGMAAGLAKLARHK